MWLLLTKKAVALVLVTVILVLMPVEGFGKGQAFAAESAVSYSKSTLASMFLASMGMSYVLVNTAASNLRDYLDEKIQEFEVIDGGKLPGGSDNNDWKSTIGGILFGAAAVDIYNRFISFLKGEQADNTVENVYSEPGVIYLNNGFKVYQLGISFSTTSYADIYNSFEPYTYNEYLSILGDEYKYITLKDLDRRYIQLRKVSIYRRNGSSVSSLNISNSTEGILFFQDADKIIGFVVKNNDSINGRTTDLGGEIEETESISEGATIDLKTGDVMQESVPSGDGIIIEQPAGVKTWDYNPYNVPTAVPDADLWEQIAALIKENTSEDVAYNPSYEIYTDYESAENIASGSYDTPAGPEDIPAEEASPGVINELVSDLWDSFKSVFPWDQLKVKFPFSIPYDIVLFAQGLTGEEYNVLTGLPSDPGEAAPGTPPVYELDLPLPGGENTYRVTLDFSLIDDIVPFIRAGAGILFTAILFGGL